jgi:TrmH family RNA methyltransferase
MNMLDRIRIVMVNTSESGNIGAAARAMKTMGFSRLSLVGPKDFPSAKATARASGAADILQRAQLYDSLDDAIAECTLVVGTSTRLRTIPWPVLNPRAFAHLVSQESADADIAVVFGREDAGLTNEELRKCHYHLCIPGNPEYAVLNVAAAVQVICYELRMTCLLDTDAGSAPQEGEMLLSTTRWDAPLCTLSEMEGFFQHFEQALLDMEFFDPTEPRNIMPRLRRLYCRTRLDRLEMNLMRGVLTRMQQWVRGQYPPGRSRVQ